MTILQNNLRFPLAFVAGLILVGAIGASAQTQRAVAHPDWGGPTATLRLGALQKYLQYPEGDIAVDDTYGDLLSPWSDPNPDSRSMMPLPIPTNLPSSLPSYQFAMNRTILAGTVDTLTATLTVTQSQTGAESNLHIVSAQLVGTPEFGGQNLGSVPYSCAGLVCTFTWRNPSNNTQYWGSLAIQATVTVDGYPGTWIAQQDFYSSPMTAGIFTGAFKDSIVNGSLEIDAGVQVYQHMACMVTANLYSADNGWPVQHLENQMIVDPSMTSIPFTFFGKIFADYGDAGTFTLRDLQAQCLALSYPPEWYVDPETYAANLAALEGPSAPPPTPPDVYFGYNNFSFNTQSYPNRVFSSAVWQTPQTPGVLQYLTKAAAAEAAAGATAH
jgi:hypothetical protein